MGSSSPWRKFLNTTQIRNDYSERPAGLQWRSNTFFILSTIAIGLWSDMFLYSLVVPVIPFLLEDRIGVPEDQIQSYTSALLAVFAGASFAFSPPAGIFADMVSTRQAPFLLGLGCLIGATILLFTAMTFPLLALARVLQGASSAVVWTVGMAICIETVGPQNLGKTLGSIFSVIAVAALWAPFIGGLLYEKTGVKGVMGVALAVLGLDFVMRVLVIEKKVALRYVPEDEDVSDNDSDHNSASDNEAQTDEPNGHAESDERQPLLAKPEQEDLSEYRLAEQTSWITRKVTILPCLRSPALLSSLFISFVPAVIFGSIDSTVAIVSNELFGFKPLKAGTMLLPLGILDLLVGPISGWAVDRYGTKIVATTGFAWFVPMHILLRLPHAGGMDQIILYGAILAGMGIGCGWCASVSLVEAGKVVDKFYRANPTFFGDNGPYAQLYGLNSMVFNLGLTIGPELAGELKEAVGYGNMNLAIAGLCVVASVVSFFFVGGKPKMLSRKPST